MTSTEITSLKTLLKLPKSICIVAHKNPDGDAIGSSLGLYHYLLLKGHKVTVILPNAYPDFLKWVPGEPHIINYELHTAKADAIIHDCDLIFTLDFNALHRAGEMAEVLAKSTAIKVMIDHHQNPDGYANYVYSDTSICSTCQMVYHFIDMLNDTAYIDKNIATALYLGIMTDTGSFRFRSTTSTTHQVIAHLIDKGADNAQIHNNVYDTNSLSRLKLLGRAIDNLVVIDHLHTAYISLSQNDLDEFNFKKGDTEGVVNYALSIKGIKFAIIFIENKHDGIIKISFRSKGNFDVNAFARTHFDGGGHINAAGGKSDTNLTSTITRFIDILNQYKTELS